MEKYKDIDSVWERCLELRGNLDEILEEYRECIDCPYRVTNFDGLDQLYWRAKEIKEDVMSEFANDIMEVEDALEALGEEHEDDDSYGCIENMRDDVDTTQSGEVV